MSISNELIPMIGSIIEYDIVSQSNPAVVREVRQGIYCQSCYNGEILCYLLAVLNKDNIPTGHLTYVRSRYTRVIKPATQETTKQADFFLCQDKAMRAGSHLRNKLPRDVDIFARGDLLYVRSGKYVFDLDGGFIEETQE